jgi:threonine synthase
VVGSFGWDVPDAILYPTGGGVGIIGMWKVFDELEELGWIGPAAAARFRQVPGGAVVKAFHEGPRRVPRREARRDHRARIMVVKRSPTS